MPYEMVKKINDFYNKNKAEFVKKYNGKVIVLDSHFKLVGSYKERIIAIKDAISKGHKLGQILVKDVTDKDDTAHYFGFNVKFS